MAGGPGRPASVAEEAPRGRSSKGVGLGERGGGAELSHDVELLLATLLAELVEVPVWPGVLRLSNSESVGVNDPDRKSVV